MVRICDTPFEGDLNLEYPFELSDFQKYAIQGILSDKHVLITAGTGSGKTLPAEHAIRHFHSKGKKTIYISPIKALSNQKYHEFSKKFPDIDFGILTGDIKHNPGADCVIMTAEILRNNLFNVSSTTGLEMDLQKDLACLIIDEVHFINDSNRGEVWEEIIMGIPDHVQLLMLSATINHPEKFAKWVEGTKNKEVWLAPTYKRVVPLKHYSFLKIPEFAINKIADKSMKRLVNKFNGHPQILMEKSSFNDENYYQMKKILDYLTKNKIFIKKNYVLNETIDYLNENEMLPAIFFSLSRKNVEYFASQITSNLHSDPTKISTTEKECKKIIMKLPNYSEYINMPEFGVLVKLLEKGIAFHHSGMIPIYREMVEILFGKGYVKLLFATETFAVGINMPTKTVIFDSFSKFDGIQRRLLHSHEYTQMAGRAGRRGLDTVGHVFHLSGIFREYPTFVEYRELLMGNPQVFRSKFKINFNLVFRLLSIDRPFSDFIEGSMVNDEITGEFNACNDEIVTKSREIDAKMSLLRSKNIGTRGTDRGCPDKFMESIEEYDRLLNSKTKKTHKKVNAQLNNLRENNNYDIENNVTVYREILKSKEKLSKMKREKENIKSYTTDSINTVVKILEETEFVKDNQLTEKGKIASHIQEAHSLVLSDIIPSLENLTVEQLASVLIVFSQNGMQEDSRSQLESIENAVDSDVFEILKSIRTLANEYYNIELSYNINSHSSYDIQYDLCELIVEWCKSEDENSCKVVIQKAKEMGIHLGTFTKAVLKMNNLAKEIRTAVPDNLKLLVSLSEIEEKSLKFMITNQSLYV
jgi:superfamily II RNA helicase